LPVAQTSEGAASAASLERELVPSAIVERFQSADVQGLVSAPPAAVPPDPAIAWGQALDRLRVFARRSASQTGSTDVADGWKERVRVVEWLASGTPNPASMAVLTGAVAAIADVAGSSILDGATRAAQIKSAVLALEDRAPLAVAHLKLCRKVIGFGAFEPMQRSELKTGQPAVLYCEMTGIRYETKHALFVSRLYSRVELLSVKDNTRVWEQALGEAEDRCRNRRRDYYVNYRICLPATVAPGKYRLRLNQTDLVARQTASADLAVTIIQ
jgi:hypothetical protein